MKPRLLNRLRCQKCKSRMNLTVNVINKTVKILLYSPPEFPIMPAINLSKLGTCSIVAFILKIHKRVD